MDCCSHEGPAKGDAKFDFKKIADGVHVAVAAPAYKVNATPRSSKATTAWSSWIRTPSPRRRASSSRERIQDHVRQGPGRGATLDEVQRRVPDRLAPTYEKPFSTYGDYRPWRAGLLRNIERAYAMLS